MLKTKGSIAIKIRSGSSVKIINETLTRTNRQFTNLPNKLTICKALPFDSDIALTYLS
jgi:hypothetical protein